MAAGSPTTLSLVHGKPSSPFLLLIGAALLNAPFKGGTLVPVPLLFVPVMTNYGRASLTAPWPAGWTAGLRLVVSIRAPRVGK